MVSEVSACGGCNKLRESGFWSALSLILKIRQFMGNLSLSGAGISVNPFIDPINRLFAVINFLKAVILNWFLMKIELVNSP